jgi:hypothetical protein
MAAREGMLMSAMLIIDMLALIGASCPARTRRSVNDAVRPHRCFSSDDDACLDCCDRRRWSGVTSLVVAAESRMVTAMTNVTTFIVIYNMFRCFTLIAFGRSNGSLKK